MIIPEPERPVGGLIPATTNVSRCRLGALRSAEGPVTCAVAWASPTEAPGYTRVALRVLGPL